MRNINAFKTLSSGFRKLKEEEALDGYYAIVTSEHEETDDRIIEMYRGSKIESLLSYQKRP